MSITGEPIPNQIFEAIAKAPPKPPEVKKLIDPRTISKNTDQQGRDWMATKIRESRQLRDEITSSAKNPVELQTIIPEKKTKQNQLPDTKTMVNDYYEKIVETPLTNQEKRDLLKPEVVAQLSVDEYITLWKRLNPQFLSHITRQGFRDHIGMNYHSARVDEYSEGFLRIMRDENKLRPSIALDGLRGRDKSSVQDYLNSWVLQATNKEEAANRLDNLLNLHLISAAPKYPDKTAVHFAAQMVPDKYYGGESDNEVFFIFPSDILASQNSFAFNGWEKTFMKPQSEIKWNDVFIWPSTLDNPGISIDAGAVFLPETTPVDPTTGSKYTSEVKIVDGKEKRVKLKKTENPIPSKEYWEKFFSENPTLKPKHVIYYDGDPTSAVYKFQEKNGIGAADTSKTDGQLLGFDDHHIIDLVNDPRANRGYQDLIDMGNNIIEEHYE